MGQPWGRQVLAPAVAQLGVVWAGAVGRGLLVPEPWYLAPGFLLAVALAAGLAASGRWRVVAGLAAVYALGSAWLWRHRLEPSSWSAYVAARDTGRWLDTHVPPDAVLAGWDVGITAATARRRFLQLEGLMGSWEYRRDWLASRPVVDWLDHHGADFVAQPYLLEPFRRARQRGGPVGLGAWPLVHAECFQFTGFFSTAPQAHVFVVLARPGTAPGFQALSEEALCGGP